MAERRMISKSLLMDNKFLGLSNDTKALYIYLLSFADDDGIVKRSMMIDSVLRVDDSNYSALEENGLIIPDQNDQIKVITDWNSLQSIRKDIYRQTTYLEVRSQLFMRTDYSYTKDPNDKNVFSSADDWIRNGRPKDITDFKPLIQQHLKEVQYMDGTSTVQVQDMDGTSASPDQNRSDQYRLDQSRTDQDSKDQISQEKINSANMQLSSSNGGMGENASSVDSSNSSKDHNATSESGRDTGLPSGADTGVNNDTTNNSQDKDVKIMIGYIDQVFNLELSESNQRIALLLETILNKYEEKYVKDAIDDLEDDYSGVNEQQLTSLFC